MYRQISAVEFPDPTGIMINMMPFILGDEDSLPEEMHPYLDMIDACSGLEKGEKAYLTINVSDVKFGEYQRRPGIHTDGTSLIPEEDSPSPGDVFGEGSRLSWGGGWGGTSSSRGIYVASTDGRCRIWDMTTYDVDSHGGLFITPRGKSEELLPNHLYWMTDRTPHESLPSLKEQTRQFFRVVADEIGVWFSKHSTPSPFGILPNVPIVHTSKF